MISKSLNGNSGSRMHNESLRVGYTPLYKREKWDDYALAKCAEIEKQTARCAKCGKPALYRVYDRGKVNRGACSAHRDLVRRSSTLFQGRDC